MCRSSCVLHRPHRIAPGQRPRVTMPNMWQRFPIPMRKAVATALEEAARLGHEEAAPEHLLLAIVRDPDCGASFLLRQAGVKTSDLTRELEPNLVRGGARIQRAARVSSTMMHVLDVAAG